MDQRVILVTGAAGFIGSNFVNYYMKKYPDVKIVNFDKLDYCSNKDNIDNQNENYVFVHGNITNKEYVLHILNQYNITHIIHFAAQSHVQNSFGNSVQFTIDNVLGTHVLAECAKEYGKIQRFLHMSTDEVYGEVSLDHSGCTEKESLLCPTSPYSASKCGAEFVVRSYYYSFNLPIIIIRANNVYGMKQYPEKVIPKFIMHLKNNEKLTIHGKGKTRRNFIHADDVSAAVDLILEKGEINNIYNIGTNNEFSVIDIANKLLEYIKPGEKLDDWIEYVADRNFNDFRYAINSDALRKLGWSEKVNFDDGLKETIEFYLHKYTPVS
jgi:dTDP-glucose 4,6-dehydratase